MWSDLEEPVAEVDPIAVERSTRSGRRARARVCAVERPHAFLAVGPRRARDQPRGIDEVRRATFVHPHRRAREPAEQRAAAAGMIDVDVRHDDVREIVRTDPERIERATRRRRRRRPVPLRRGRAPRQQTTYTALSSRCPVMPVSIAVMPGAASRRRRLEMVHARESRTAMSVPAGIVRRGRGSHRHGHRQRRRAGRQRRRRSGPAPHAIG